MPPSEQLEEIGALATLVDENRFSYSLDSLCAWRGLPGKDETLLQEAVEAAGFKISRRTRCNHTSGNYRRDLSAPTPRQIRSPRWGYSRTSNPILDQEGTRDAYRLEVDLLPMVHEMRRRGIRVDQSAAEQARDYCLQKRDQALAELSKQLGSPRQHGTRSRRQNGRREPLTPITSTIRAQRKATRRSRPANWDGWPRIRIGCRS